MESLQGNAADTSKSDPVSTKLERIATLAEQMPDKALFTLNHCLDRDLLRLHLRDERIEVEAVGLHRRVPGGKDGGHLLSHRSCLLFPAARFDHGGPPSSAVGGRGSTTRI